MAICVGVDVSKAKVDVALSDGTDLGSFDNSVEGFGALVARLSGLDVHRVVLEASGGYERLGLATLHAAELRVVLVQPVRARHYAKARGRYPKTDKIDALMLAKMAVDVVGEMPLWAPLDRQLARLRALVERRMQVVGTIDAETKRLRDATEEVGDSIACIVAVLKAELKRLDGRIAEVVAADPELAARVGRLTTVKGVGFVTAVKLLVWVPELGTLNRREIAALAGLAPLNRDSGTWSGQRYIFGGRRSVRTALYMAAVTAIRSNEHIKRHYAQLVARGKRSKVAMVACMRKLLIHLNALLRDHAAPTDAAPAPSP